VPAIPFVKASACGNDFLLVEGAVALSDLAAATRRLCDRHEGVGADGVEWLYPAEGADAEIRLINADGSDAEISGNGTRCVAALICSEQGKEKITIRTGAGLKTCTLISRNEQEHEFEMEMGQAQVGAEVKLTTSFGAVTGIPVSMGNPHFVCFVNQFAEDWVRRVAEVQRDQHFKQGVNVEMLVIDNKHNIQARFFERGAGETQSSGTGSCASAVAAIATGKAESPVKVHAPGGTQTVRLEAGRVFLRGSARLVCRGEFYL
jgi:diaminopimelate epimerase